MKKNKLKGIEFKTLLFILLFNIGIILVFGISELIVLEKLYKSHQINNLNSLVETFKNSKQDTYVLAEKLAYDNEVCISVVDKNYVTYNFNTMQKGCMLNKGYEKVNRKINDFLESNDLSKEYRMTNQQTNTLGVIYAIKVYDKDVFIYSNLENTSSFFEIFINQLGYFTILIILVSIIISIFLANKITKPIREINDKAKNIGKHQGNIKFPRNGINEIDMLADTLEELQVELNKSDELKREILANVSHDLKTPLTMIKAYAEMIYDFSYQEHDKMQEHLKIIMEESDRLTILVNDILELSKVNNNQGLYNYEEYDLVKEIKKIIKRYSVIKETENYHFELNLPKKAVINADKNKINQVIYNLLNNAINYTGDDKIVKINVLVEPKHYLIEIIDTGKGIKESELPYIWDKYYKSEKKHQRNVVSTGLGLSIVKEILNNHNFEYGVISKKNKGSTFYFRINR